MCDGDGRAAHHEHKEDDPNGACDADVPSTQPLLRTVGAAKFDPLLKVTASYTNLLLLSSLSLNIYDDRLLFQW